MGRMRGLSWPFQATLFLFLALSSCPLTSGNTETGPLLPSSSEGILTRSWNYFENLVSAAFEEEVKAPAQDPSLDRIRAEIRRRFRQYRAQVEEAHGLGRDHEEGRSRGRRAVITADSAPPGRRRRNITEYQSVGTHVVTKVYPLSPQPYDYRSLADLNIVQIKDTAYLFSLEESEAGTFTCIYKIDKNLNPRQIYRLETAGATTVEVFEIDQNYYVLPGEYNETSPDPINAGSNLYRFDLLRNTLDKVQTIHTEYARSLHFWKGSGQEANDVFLCVAPEYRSTGSGRSYEVGVSVYRWQGAYFDYLYQIPAYNPQAVQYAKVQSTDYLAIANYQDDSKSTSINTELFRYNHKEDRFVSFQKIRTQGAKDVQFFNVREGQREENYLAIANHCQTDTYGKSNYRVSSYILKFAKERYIPFQSIETYGAFQMLPVRVDDISYIVIGELDGFRIVQYNGWRYKETYGIKYEGEVRSSGLKFRPFPYGKKPFFTLASREGHVEGGIYALDFEQKNEYNAMSRDLETWCSRALSTVEGENMAGLLKEVAEAPKTTDPEIVLQAGLTFTGDLAVTTLFGKTMHYGGQVFDAKASKDLAEKEARLKYLEEELRTLAYELTQVVKRNETQTVYTRINFGDVDYYGQVLRASRVETELLNDHRLSDLFPNLIFLDKDYSLATVTIRQLTTSQHIEVEKLNGYDLSDFALKSAGTVQTFTGKNKFLETGTSAAGFETYGLVDGLDFRNIDFLLKTGNQTFVGGLNIRDSTVNNLVANIVNNVDLQYFYIEAVSKAGPDTISGAKYFDLDSEFAFSANSFRAESLLAGHNISQLYETAVYTKGVETQTFEARETSFERLTLGSLQLASNVINDRYNVETDFVSISSGKYNIESMDLLYDTYVDELVVNGSLNRVQVIDGQLDLILKDSPSTQLIGNKVAEHVILEKSSEAYGLVDGVNLTGWSNVKYIQLPDNRPRFGKFAPNGTLSLLQGMHIQDYGRFYMGSSDVSAYLSKALRLDATRLPDSFRRSVIFDSVLVDGNTEVRTLNRVSPSSWLTSSVETGLISGRKTFTGDIKILAPSSAKALFYSLDRYGENVLRGFDDLLIDGADQTILRNTVFSEGLRVDRLECPAVVLNGIPFQDLLLVNGDQSIAGKVSFRDQVTVQNSFVVSGNVEAELVNGYSLSTTIEETLRTVSRTPQVFQGNAIFEQGLAVADILSAGTIGGYNLTLLLGGIIRDDDLGSKVIPGSLTFSKGAKLERLDFTGTLNGIADENWGEGYLLSTGHQTIYTPVIFKGTVKVENLTVSNDKVSGINFVRLANEVLRLDEGGSMGVVYFDQTLSSGTDVRLDGTVNGYKIQTDFLLRNGQSPQTFTADKTFLAGLKIEGDLSVKTLAGIHYDQAAKFAFGKNDATESLRIEGNLVLKNEPFFSESFNGESWNDLVKGIWWTNEPVSLGPIQFSHIVLQEGGSLSGNLSGVDLRRLQAQYLSRTQDQRISGKFIFENGVTFEDLNIQILRLNGGKINGVSLEEFQESVLLDGVDQRIVNRMTFLSLDATEIELEEGSLVGGLNLGKDTLTLHGNNVVEGQKTLEGLTVGKLVLGDGTLLAKINLKDWTEQAVRAYEASTIKGPLEFDAATFNKHLHVEGYVDGLTFTKENIFTLSGDQTLEGLYTFKGHGFQALAEIEVGGKFNGYNLEKILGYLVQRDYGTGPLVVTGVKTFTRPLNVEYLQTEGLYQGHNINETLDGMKPEAYLSGNYTDSLEDKYLYLTQLATELHTVADRRAVVLEYYEESSTILISGAVGLKALGPDMVVASGSYAAQSLVWWTFDVTSQAYREDLIRKGYVYKY